MNGHYASYIFGHYGIHTTFTKSVGNVSAGIGRLSSHFPTRARASFLRSSKSASVNTSFLSLTRPRHRVTITFQRSRFLQYVSISLRDVNFRGVSNTLNVFRQVINTSVHRCLSIQVCLTSSQGTITCTKVLRNYTSKPKDRHRTNRFYSHNRVNVSLFYPFTTTNRTISMRKHDRTRANRLNLGKSVHRFRVKREIVGRTRLPRVKGVN